MLEDVREFPFPRSLTRRERSEFSKVAGITVQALAGFLEEDNTAEITPEMEAALIMVAARRVDPSVTFDQAMDHDGWTIGPPAPLEGADDAAPLAPPTSPATSEL